MTAEYELPEGMTVEQDDYLNEIFQRLVRLRNGFLCLERLIVLVGTAQPNAGFREECGRLLDQMSASEKELGLRSCESPAFPCHNGPGLSLFGRARYFRNAADAVLSLGYSLLPKYAHEREPGWALAKVGEPVFFESLARLEQAVIGFGSFLQPLVRESLKSLTAMADHLGCLD